jgi:hypothetical protein
MSVDEFFNHLAPGRSRLFDRFGLILRFDLAQSAHAARTKMRVPVTDWNTAFEMSVTSTCEILSIPIARCTGRREINDPALDEGAAVINPHHHSPPVSLVRYEHKLTERQCLVGGSQVFRVDLLTIGSQWSAAVGIGRPIQRCNTGLGMRGDCNSTKHKRGKNAFPKHQTPKLLLKRTVDTKRSGPPKLYHLGQEFLRFGTLSLSISPPMTLDSFSLGLTA